ncbi:MAG: serine hydrolase, partial [Acidimicrobiia bacterium]|nr:serine hydrolase [Acidimicrobiia bacterium]
SRDRFVSLYTPAAGGMQRIDSFDTSHYHQHPTFLGGGGGLVSTIDDYQRFCDMLLAGGSGNGSRIIGPKTLAYMTTNHLSGGATLNEMGQSLFSETALEGTGFGLGFSVTVDPAALGAASSEGDYGWGGAASTAFWIDPAEELSVIFLTQLLPSSSYPIRRQLRSVVYQALTS